MTDALEKKDAAVQCCKNCLYWIKEPAAPGTVNGDRALGRCHNGPPTPLIIMSQHPITQAVAQVIQGAFPPTLAGEWCGAWEPDNDALADRL